MSYKLASIEGQKKWFLSIYDKTGNSSMQNDLENLIDLVFQIGVDFGKKPERY